MPEGKSNNPQGINQYTKNNQSSAKLSKKQAKKVDEYNTALQIQKDLGFNKRYQLGTGPNSKILLGNTNKMTKAQLKTAEFIYNSAEQSKDRIAKELNAKRKI